MHLQEVNNSCSATTWGPDLSTLERRAMNEWMDGWMQMAGQQRWGGPGAFGVFSTGVQGLECVVKALSVNSTLHKFNTSTCWGSKGWWHRKRAAGPGLIEQNGWWVLSAAEVRRPLSSLFATGLMCLFACSSVQNYLLAPGPRRWCPSFTCGRKSGMNSCPLKLTLWSVKRPESRADQLQAPRLYITNELCSQRATDLSACFSDYWKKQNNYARQCLLIKLIILNLSPSSHRPYLKHRASFRIRAVSIIPEKPAGRNEMKTSALCWPIHATATPFFLLCRLWIVKSGWNRWSLHNIGRNSEIIYWPWRCTFAWIPHCDFWLGLIGFTLSAQRNNQNIPTQKLIYINTSEFYFINK